MTFPANLRDPAPADDGPRAVLAYGVAVLMALGAVVLTAVLWAPGERRLMVLAFAVLLTSLFGGGGPALVAAALTALGGLWLLHPTRELLIAHPADATDFGVFLVMAALSSWLGLSLRNSRLRLQRESAGRELERQRLQAILEILPAGLLVLGADGRIVEANRAAEDVWGLQELVGRPSDDYRRSRGWHPDSHRPLTIDEWPSARALGRGEVTVGEEIEIETFDGRHRTVLNSAVPLRTGDGRIVGGVVLNVDITRQKEVEAALQQQIRERDAAYRELDAFSYSVSHDLRAPLRAISGFSEALFEDYGDRLDSQGQDYLRRIREAVRRMNHLIDDMLRLSRVSRRSLHAQAVDFSALVRQAAADVAQGEPGHAVELVVPDGLKVFADPYLLRSALDNLLGNAWKFTRGRPGARIEVGATAIDGETVYFVRDNGIGFDMAYADKLFEPFERLHGGSTYEGTGIGLAITARIVHRHGGQIWAQGEPGRGTTFFFTLTTPPTRAGVPPKVEQERPWLSRYAS